MIIPYVAEVLVGMLDGNLDPQAAAAEPHFANPNGPTILEKDTSIAALAPQLTAMGHTVIEHDLESGSQIIERVSGGYIGGADPRRDGAALGD